MGSVTCRVVSLIAYLAVAAVSLFATHRLLERIDWKRAALLTLLPFVIVGPALLTSRIYAPIDLPYNAQPLKSMAALNGVEHAHNGFISDLYTQMMPWRFAVRHAYASGEWPHLNPFSLAGDVLAGSAQPAPYHPLTLIALLLPPGHEFTFTAAIALFLASLGAWLWGRDLGCSPATALIAAAGWMTADFVLFWIGWPIGVTASALPWIMLAVSRLVSRRTPGAMAFLTIVFVWLLLAGHPETVLHHVATAAAFGIWRIRALQRAEILRAGLLATGAGVLALMISAIAILPFAEAMGETFESAYRRDVWRAARKSVTWDLVAPRLAANVIPFAFGRPESENAVFPDGDLLIPSTAWVGLIPFPLAWIAFRRSRHRDLPFLLGLLLAGLWIGLEAPGLTDFVGSLPLFAITLNDRLVLIAAFALITLAAIGAESWSANPSRRRLATAMFMTAGVFAVGVAVLYPWLTGALALTPGFVGSRAAFVIVPLVLAAICVMVLRTPAHTIGIIALLLVVERVASSGRMYPSIDARAFYPRFAGLDVMRQGAEPQRFTGRAYTIIPGTAAAYGLEDVRGYQAITNLRLHETFTLWSVPQPVWFNRVDDLTAPMLRMLNVRWALVDDASFDPPAGWRVAWRGPHYRILENTQALSRAYIPESVIPTGSRFPESMRANGDFGELSWIGPELDSTSDDGDGSPTRNGRGRVAIRRDGAGFVLDAMLRERAWIVVSQTAWKGWRARSEAGTRVPLHYGNHAFLAMELPAGRHTVSLDYEPRTFRVALVLTVVGLLGFFALVAVVVITRRRRVG